MTTIASVWTHAQFLDGTAIKGPALGLRIAAGNVHNFVDLATGGGAAISDALNGAQTPTMPWARSARLPANAGSSVLLTKIGPFGEPNRTS